MSHPERVGAAAVEMEMGGRARGNPHPTRAPHRSATRAAGPPVVTQREDTLPSPLSSLNTLQQGPIFILPRPSSDAGVLAHIRGDMPCGSVVLPGRNPQRQMRSGHDLGD